MRIECEACRQIVTADFAIDGSTLRATCPSCQVTMTTEIGARPPEPPAAVCPKCGTPRGAEPACPRCGLAADKVAEYAANRDAAIPELVRAGWQRVVDDWSSPASHDALLTLVTRDGCFAWAAARYREVSRARPDDPIASRELARLARAAEVALRATATAQPERESSAYAASTVILFILVAVIAIGVIVAILMQAGGPPPPPVPSG